jgi:UDP:flavonoid glycosyltransferase YjiC (YdhE family)
MTGRIYIPTLGIGLGHVSRMALVARSLVERRMEVAFSSSAQALDYLEREGFPCKEVPMIDLGWDDENGFILSSTLVKLPRNATTFLAQIRRELRTMKEFRPDLVLSDTRLSALIAAHRLGIPNIVVLNQIRILKPSGGFPDSPSFLEELGASVLGSLWCISDEILVPDLPPPYTISERNLWSVGSAEDKMTYVGLIASSPRVRPRVAAELSTKLAPGGKPLVFAHISGPRETKETLIRGLLEIASKLGDDYSFVISEGEPTAKAEPVKVKGAWYYGWCPSKDELLSIADVTIIRGGHSSIAQAIPFGKPLITIPIENQSEQLGNARKVAKLGLGICVRQSELDAPTLRSALDIILGTSSYIQTATKMREMAEKYDGLSNITARVRARIGA